MKSRAGIVLLLLLLLLMMVPGMFSPALYPAMAQAPKGLDRQDAYFAFSAMIDCSVRRHAKPARDVLTTVPGSREERAAINMVMGKQENSCLSIGVLGGKMSLRPALVRGGVAEALLRWDVNAKRVRLEALQSLPPSSGPVSFSECVVRANPTLAADLIVKTRSGQPYEMVAIRGLAPAISGCLPSGQQFNLSRETVRYGIAEALYHVLEAGAH